MDASFDPSAGPNNNGFEFEDSSFRQGARSDGFKTWNSNMGRGGLRTDELSTQPIDNSNIRTDFYSRHQRQSSLDNGSAFGDNNNGY